MKSFNDLKCRSKLPSYVQTAAKNCEACVKECHEFCVEQVELDELRFIWWVIDPATDVKTIVDIMEFSVDPKLAAEIMKKNNPDGAI